MEVPGCLREYPDRIISDIFQDFTHTPPKARKSTDVSSGPKKSSVICPPGVPQYGCVTCEVPDEARVIRGRPKEFAQEQA